MDTDLPAAVAPFDGAFADPPEASRQGNEMRDFTQSDGTLVLYEMENPNAWIKAGNPLEWGGGR